MDVRFPTGRRSYEGLRNGGRGVGTSAAGLVSGSLRRLSAAFIAIRVERSFVWATNWPLHPQPFSPKQAAARVAPFIWPASMARQAFCELG